MIYGSVCSGIEAASVAWEPLGMVPAWFAEIDPFASAVLVHHWPDVPNLGDFTKIGADHGPVDLLVGGTPCQAFSVAGRRAGLDDPRGNLTLEFLALAGRLRPRWLVWENVPGVLSIDKGRTFGQFLWTLGQLGYGFAYRVLDAQHFGVPQRRRRVFVVGHSGGLWQRAAAVLFERHSLSGDPPPSREAGQDVAGCLGGGSGERGWAPDTDRMTFVPSLAGCVTSREGQRQDPTAETLIPFDTTQITSEANYSCPRNGDPCHPLAAGSHAPAIAHSLRADGFDASEDGTGRGTPLGPVAFDWYASESQTLPVTEECPPLKCTMQPAVAFTERGRRAGRNLEVQEDLAYCLCNPGSGGRTHSRQIMADTSVRRLTPRECERLQGFPDVRKTVIIRVWESCSESQKSDALAAIRSPRLPRPAGNAGSGESPATASSAESSLTANCLSTERPVALSVLIDLEVNALEIHSQSGSRLFAGSADRSSSFHLPASVESFAQLGALMSSVMDLIIHDGKAASPQSRTCSSLLPDGRSFVLLSGQEIAGRVSGAAQCINEARSFMKSTTSQAGLSFQNLEQTLVTLCSCVVHATSSFIPEPTTNTTSYDLSLTLVSGHTLVPYRGKPAADGPRYRAIGNSMAVPCMAWIGRRILTVEASA